MLTSPLLHLLGQAAAAHANMTAKMVMDRVSHKTKIDVFENAFRKIKEVGWLSGRRNKEMLYRIFAHHRRIERKSFVDSTKNLLRQKFFFFRCVWGGDTYVSRASDQTMKLTSPLETKIKKHIFYYYNE